MFFVDSATAVIWNKEKVSGKQLFSRHRIFVVLQFLGI